MKTKMLTLSIAALCGFGIAGGAALQNPAHAANNPKTYQQAQAEIPMEKAIETAKQKYDGVISEVELDHDMNRLVYEIEFQKGNGKTLNIKMDANTGKVINKKTDKDDDPADYKTDLSIEKAVKIAEQKYDGTVSEVELEKQPSGKIVYEFEIHQNNGKLKVVMDANSGDILSHSTVNKDNDDDQNTDDDQDYQDQKTNGHVKISKQDAIKIAENNITGKAVSSKIDHDDGKTIYKIKIKTKDGSIYKAEIDANSGKLLEMELDD
ncbi:PepSY domain-containing protein [Scopulibacillus cellulosilyticus]|uniref:PepSY domain-containing protein n=1 Tax=Scopulibacillus cellulosilyticus TaxID=2665665 RepID=A0ABW2PRN4_9BACL